MTLNIVHVGIPLEPHQLVVLHSQTRTYAAASSKGDRFHLIQPAILEDPRVGDGHRRVGELVCSCASGLYARGVCWAVKLALAYEIGMRPEPTWLREPVPIVQEARP